MSKKKPTTDPYLARLSALVRGELERLGPGATQAKLAEQSGLLEQQISQVLNLKNGLTAESFQKLQSALWWVKPEQWLELLNPTTR